MMPDSEYIEARSGGYYVAGTRIGLDVVASAFKRGRTAEDIFRSFPTVGSLAKTYGVLTFILEHPEAVEAYLQAQLRAWEELQTTHPLPPEMLEPFESDGAGRLPKVA